MTFSLSNVIQATFLPNQLFDLGLIFEKLKQTVLHYTLKLITLEVLRVFFDYDRYSL